MQKEAGILLAVVVGVLLLIASLNEEEQPENCPDGSCPIQLVESLADVPPLLRTPNHSPYNYGSCVHVSTCTMLKWIGEEEMAEWWYNTYNSGEYADRLIKRMEAAGLKFAYTDTGDVRFLEWAARNRMVIGVFYFRLHAVNLVDFNDREAVLLDNNDTSDYIRVPKSQFVHRWQNEFGGFAWAIVGSPPPPWPTWASTERPRTSLVENLDGSQPYHQRTSGPLAPLYGSADVSAEGRLSVKDATFAVEQQNHAAWESATPSTREKIDTYDVAAKRSIEQSWRRSLVGPCTPTKQYTTRTETDATTGLKTWSCGAPDIRRASV